MRLTPSDPDVQTLIARISSRDIDLQPDFQRGEVWPTLKKQRLIDSILREWHVPPIHLIVDAKTQRTAVLDGQQRLVAIRDFSQDELTVDGNIEPANPHLKQLHGLRFSELPAEWKLRFLQFTIRVFRISDYEAAEPAELFFRLNQPTALTSAEKRNAFFGAPREQIRELAAEMEYLGLGRAFWGFSNSRMAYDDILARTCLALEYGSFRRKVTSAGLADRYRSGEPFQPKAIRQLRSGIRLLGKANERPMVLALNKATAQSCLLLASRIADQVQLDVHIVELVSQLLRGLSDLKLATTLDSPNAIRDALARKIGPKAADWIIFSYEDRATSRVADSASVTIRDCALWLFLTVLSDSSLELSEVQEIKRLRQALLSFEFKSGADFERWVLGTSWDLTLTSSTER